MSKFLKKAIQHYIQTVSPAFLVGNGINLYNSKDSSKTWNSLLENALYECLKDDVADVNKIQKALCENSVDRLSNTELCDIINIYARKFDASFLDEDPENIEDCNKEIADKKKSKSSVQKCFEKLIKDCFKRSDESGHFDIILNYLSQNSMPVLTTNYDSMMESTLSINSITTLDSSKIEKRYCSHYAYPWNKCFIPKPPEEKIDESFVLNNFAIWHIHGFCNDSEMTNLQLGFNQYARMIKRAKVTIEGGKEKLSLYRDNEKFFGSNTWLNIFFHKNLVIFGLNLGKDEIFLRWLLLERRKYLDKMSKEEKLNLWHNPDLYLTTLDTQMSHAQRVFLEACGFEVVELSSYKELYEDLWQNWPEKV